MRLKYAKPVYVRNRIVTKDPSEGGSLVSYDTAYSIAATVYDQDGEQKTNQYGKTLPLNKKMLIDNSYTVSNVNNAERYSFPDGTYIQAADGICLYTDSASEPDYEVMTINAVGHLQVVIAKR